MPSPPPGSAVPASSIRIGAFPVADELSRLSGGLPVFADNDVRMYVYGEAVCGAGAGHGHVLGVTLGTGMACAFVDNGRLFYGGGCMAGEIGHILTDDIPYRCSCGQTGCLETAVSATGIARQAAEKLRAGADSLLRAKLGTDAAERVTAADVSAGYDEGDALCVEIMERTGMWLGRALAIACAFYSPDIVVIGGGASLAGERLLAPARKTMRERLLPELAARIAVTTAALTDDAGVIGSALFAGRQLQTRGG
jgi:glucokinase